MTGGYYYIDRALRQNDYIHFMGFCFKPMVIKFKGMYSNVNSTAGEASLTDRWLPFIFFYMETVLIKQRALTGYHYLSINAYTKLLQLDHIARLHYMHRV